MQEDYNNDSNENQKITSSSLDTDDIKKENKDYTIYKIQQEQSITKIKNSDNKNLLLFKEMYHQAIIESFEILGKQVSEIVINYLEEKHSLHLEDTVDNPQILDEVLEDAINGGRRIVERKIIKILNQKLKIRNSIIELNRSDFTYNILNLKKLYLEMKST
ncbi:MAG TPA: hypothetical protein VJP58_10850 [Candidatus Nitrosocosmicus sp.]|nr:hypothetical protein [Candidatus Nitrosocosmicus sp.]